MGKDIEFRVWKVTMICDYSCQNLRETFGDGQDENKLHSLLHCEELNPTHNLYEFGLQSWVSIENASQWASDFLAQKSVWGTFWQVGMEHVQ